jgi:D-3-phosphoglycerate dehydrogenase / 2-oxoglutarate reductase
MKKKILYFEQLKFQETNLKILNKKFKIVNGKKLHKIEKKEIISIFLPMNNFYSSKFFFEFKNLRSVVTPTTGDIHLDKEYLIKKNIKIINLANEKSKLNQITSTSEHTLGLIMNLTRKILNIHQVFIQNKKFNKYNHLLSNNELTLGIVGMGRIGKHVADRAHALGFKILYLDPFVKYKNYKKIYSLRELVKKTNILSIHMHYKNEYFQKFDKNIFNNLKKPSYLINTSRGEFINEKDLIKSIKNKTIYGAGLDVLHNEHTKKFRSNPKSSKIIKFFLKNKKCNLFISPKQGGSNKNAWELTEKIIINKLIKYEKNKN